MKLLSERLSLTINVRSVQRTRGTPQGGVISPLLANLFLHYTFDVWMTRTYPNAPWCRYADDGLVHCESMKEAQAIKAALEVRFAACGLTMHPTKTKIVYCRDGRRTGTHDHTKFTFLGYEFRQRYVKSSKTAQLFAGFTAAVSPAALTAMRQKARRLNYRNRTDLSLQDIARKLNPILRGWIAYYGRFQPSALHPLFRYIDKSLVAWTMRKYKRFRASKTRAGGFIKGVSQKCPALFAHWKLGMAGAFA